MHKTGTIYGINGPVIYLKGNTGFQMAEMVYVGKERLVGEVIRLTNDITTIQVFEETTGLRPGDPVEATGDAISVTLGPGILNNIFDGIERPLSEIAKSSGKYISRGVSVDSLDTEKKWQTHITVKPGEFVSGGTIIAEVQETQAIVHKSMVPPNISGTVLEVAWRIHDQRTDRNRSACKRKRRKTDTGSEMADPCSASDCCKIRSKQTADHRTAYPRYSVSDRQRWYCRYPWRFRYRKNHDTASDRQMVQRRHHHLHRLR